MPLSDIDRQRSKRFSLQERKKIELLLTQALGVTEIARLLDRGHSAISYEIKKNSVEGVYKAVAGNRVAKARRSESRRRPGKIEEFPLLIEHITYRLQEYWSPEQISVELLYLNDDGRPYVSYSAIYRFIYRHPELNLSIYLRTRRANRKKRSRNPQTKYDRYPPKQRTGWETDTMMFHGCDFSVSVTVNCETYKVVLSKMRREDVMDKGEALKKVIVLEDSDQMTYDQREENYCFKHFARHHGLDAIISQGVPDKPVVEHTIKLLRDFLPYGEDISPYPDSYFDEIAECLNGRIRKKLGWRCPNECGEVVLTLSAWL